MPGPQVCVGGCLRVTVRGMAVGARFRGESGTPPPTVCPGMGGSGRSRRGEGTPPYGWGYGNAMGFTRTPVPGASRGRGRACPARGLAWAAFPFYPLTLPTSPPAYSRCCRRQNRWGRSAHRPHARFRRWIRSRGASGHRRSGPEGTGVCCRRNFSSAG